MAPANDPDGARKCHWLYDQSDVYLADVTGMHAYYFASSANSPGWSRTLLRWSLDHKDDAMAFHRALHALKEATPKQIKVAYLGQAAEPVADAEPAHRVPAVAKGQDEDDPAAPKPPAKRPAPKAGVITDQDEP